ncbi:uncharacterized protein LOC119732775 [Patiria miniata]|uniref:Uncharacterized protein n=1 Tax=Patiria miniata TaxID=46514 RepID=A0A914AG08_PATMI|nr:uncharacterized protein LOC119732775 [Patiria miniata]XP_038062309.1 uncharacterized protein LOC119732775 [Patiria miniata]
MDEHDYGTRTPVSRFGEQHEPMSGMHHNMAMGDGGAVTAHGMAGAVWNPVAAMQLHGTDPKTAHSYPAMLIFVQQPLCSVWSPWQLTSLRAPPPAAIGQDRRLPIPISNEHSRGQRKTPVSFVVVPVSDLGYPVGSPGSSIWAYTPDTCQPVW